MNAPRQWWQDMPERYDETAAPLLTVYPVEATDTGLVDANGNPIMRAPRAIGFLRNGDERE